MTKQECAIVTAYTEFSMLRGDDLQYLYRYLSEIVGRPVFTYEIPAVCEQFRDRIKADFIALCRNASDDIEPEVRHGRWIEGKTELICSACNWHYSDELPFMSSNGLDAMQTAFAYCPHCGAMMDGGADDE